MQITHSRAPIMGAGFPAGGATGCVSHIVSRCAGAVLREGTSRPWGHTGGPPQARSPRPGRATPGWHGGPGLDAAIQRSAVATAATPATIAWTATTPCLRALLLARS